MKRGEAKAKAKARRERTRAEVRGIIARFRAQDAWGKVLMLFGMAFVMALNTSFAVAGAALVGMAATLLASYAFDLDSVAVWAVVRPVSIWVLFPLSFVAVNIQVWRYAYEH